MKNHKHVEMMADPLFRLKFWSFSSCKSGKLFSNVPYQFDSGCQVDSADWLWLFHIFIVVPRFFEAVVETGCLQAGIVKIIKEQLQRTEHWHGPDIWWTRSEILSSHAGQIKGILEGAASGLSTWRVSLRILHGVFTSWWGPQRLLYHVTVYGFSTWGAS